MKIVELNYDNVYVDSENWICGIENDDGSDRSVKLGIIFKAYDLREMDNEHDEDVYPVVVEASIVPQPDELDAEFLESALYGYGEDIDEPALKTEAAHQYAGGVPVVMESIRAEKEDTNIDFEIHTINNPRYGEIKVRRFRSIEDALEFSKTIYAQRAVGVFGMIGFFLDAPINLIGTTGWDTIMHQAAGKEIKYF